MPSLELEFEVFCATCREGLCNQCEEGYTHSRKMPFISVEPCKYCLEKAMDNAGSPLEDKIEMLEAEIKELKQEATL